MKRSGLNKLSAMGGIAATVAFVIAIYIATYGEPQYDRGQMDYLRQFAQPNAEREYDIAYTHAVERGRNNAARTAQYQQLDQQIQEMEMSRGYYTPAVRELRAHRDSIEEKFINDAFRTDSAFIAADNQLRNVYDKIDKLTQDSIDVAAVRALPLRVRVKNNCRNFQQDINRALVKYHQHRLNTLQKSATQNQK